jgi:WD40 repeat protein/serine/threonine protein kinase
MANNSCPFCNSPLNEADSQAGKCSHCGKPIGSVVTAQDSSEASQEHGTVSGHDASQTVDSTKISPAAADALKQDDATGSQVDQTIDSDDFAPVQAAESSEEPADSTQGRIDQTIDSATFAPGAAEPEKEPAKKTLPKIDQTIDSATAERQAGGPQGGTVGNQALQTMVAESLPPDVATRIGETWGGSASQASDSRVTLKGQSRSLEGESTLVVQQRALRASDAQDAFNADYELLDKLGEGGMGFVYLARQAAINRVVALKMLKSDTSVDKEQRQKFLSEAVVTGDLDHPNIVPIYDLGTNEEGALFYSMKRVQGTPWMDVIKDKTQQENLEILMKVADAVAFAHARGVVHRDLKPENVMLGEYGEVLLLDWGLALPTTGFEKSQSVTQTNAMGGTPAYMAPEMATGPMEKVGAASDVYLLGAILYEIVAGKPPHAGKDVMKCLFAAAKNEIQPTDKKGELLDIAMQAMASRQEDRYATVQDFQAAIRTYLSHTESIALSTRAAEELKAARASDDYQDYSRALFAYQEAYALWDGNQRARQGISEARVAYAESAKRKNDLDLAASLLDSEDPEHAALFAEIHEAQRERDLRQHRLQRLRRFTQVTVVAFLAVVTGASIWIWNEKERARRAEKRANYERGVAVRQKGIAETAQEEEAEARAAAQDARDVAVEARKVAEEERENAIAAKQDADRQRARAEYEAYVALIGLAAARIEENAFGTAWQLLEQCPRHLRHWEWARLRHMCQLSVADMQTGSPLESVAFADNGDFITGGWKGLAEIWDGKTGRVVHTLKHGELNFVYAVAMSPDGRWAATGSDDMEGGVLRIWNVETGELVRALDGHSDAVVSVAFSGDGKRLLSASFDRTAKLWEVESGRLVQNFFGHRSWVWDAAFCYRSDAAGNPLPEEKMVTASQDGFAIVWQLDSAEMSPPFRGHHGPVYAAAFSPDGEFVATGGYDKRVLLWRPSDLRGFDFENVIRNATLREGEQAASSAIPPAEFQVLAGHSAAVRDVGFDALGQRIVSGGHDNTIKIWDAATGLELKTLRGHDSWVRSCVFSPDDRWVMSASYDQQAKRWSIDQYEEVRRVPRGRILEGHAGDILAAAFSQDRQYVVTASRDRTARKWNVADSREVVCFEEGHAFLASNAVFFSDGKRLATSAIDNTTRIWDLTSGTELVTLNETGRSAALAVSRDGRWVVTGSVGTSAQLWELTRTSNEDGYLALAGEVRQKLTGHKAVVNTVAFSPDDQLVFTGDGNGVGKLWDASDKSNLRELREFRGHTARITACAFLPDGQRLITASADGTVAQWDVATGEERRDLLMRHSRGENIPSIALASDGSLLVTVSEQGRVRVWDVERAQVLRELTPEHPRLDEEGNPRGLVQAVAVNGDGSRALTLNSEARTVRLWNLENGKEIVAPPARPDEVPGAYLDFQERGLVWSAAFSPEGTRIVTVGGDNARIWEFADDTPPIQEAQTLIPHGSVACAAFSPDGQRVVTSSWDNSARVWNATTGKGQLKLEGHTAAVNSATFSPDGLWILTGSSDQTARLWDAKTGETIRIFRGHEGAVNAAHFSPDASRIVTASADSTARVWDTASGTVVQTLVGHRFQVLCAAFSSDGTRLLTGGEDNTAKVWDTMSGVLMLQLRGHTAAVNSVAFSPDDRRALTGSGDFTAKLWDTERLDKADSEDMPSDGQEVLELRGHNQAVTSVAFSSDGVLALTGSRDGTAIIWLAEEREE